MDQVIIQEIRSVAKSLYHAAYVKEPKATKITLLHISEEYTLVASGKSSSEPDNIWTFPLGSERTAREFFKQSPPSASEIEYAINFIEEEIIPIKKNLSAGSTLFTFSPAILKVALQSDKEQSSPEITLSIKEMEDVFSRLAAIISGRPYSTDTLPDSASFAAALLILREFMHHLEFQNILINK